ncbi:MAG: hypothetical protein MJ252_03620 [archaeon]|nr:hypothetical protein [archaeon]
MGPVTQILSYLSSIGLPLKFVGVKKFEFGSCVVTSVGSVGIENSFAPIPSLTFAPLLLTVCKSYEKRHLEADGKISKKIVLQMNFTADYRFFSPQLGTELIAEVK